jgi:hypothetical protein
MAGSANDNGSDGNTGWAQYTHITPPISGIRYSLWAQTEQVQATVHQALLQLHAELCFLNAFPNIMEKKNMILSSLVTAAQSLFYSSLTKRLEDTSQRHWQKHLIEIVCCL